MTGVLYIDADPDLPGTVRAVCPSCSWRVTGIDHITAEELEELAVHHFNPALVHPSHQPEPPATLIRPEATVMLPNVAGIAAALEAGELVPINQETAAMILEAVSR